MAFEPIDSYSEKAAMTVIGVGNFGVSAIHEMDGPFLEAAKFVYTDFVARDGLVGSHVNFLQLYGIDESSKSEIVQHAVIDKTNHLIEIIKAVDLLIIVADLASQFSQDVTTIITRIAKSMQIFTIVLAAIPEKTRGALEADPAGQALKKITSCADTVLPLEIEHGAKKASQSTLDLATSINCFADVVHALGGLIWQFGLICVDLADIMTIAVNMGLGRFGVTKAKGSERAIEAARMILDLPQFCGGALSKAQGVLIVVSGWNDVSGSEFDKVCLEIFKYVQEDSFVVSGLLIDPKLQDELQVLVIATGVK